MNFKASEGSTEGTGLSYLDVPYLGPCNIIDVGLEEINNTPNCFKVTFGNLTGEDYTGDKLPSSTTHEHVEWTPNAQDDDDRVQKKIDRIAYIAGRVAPKEQVESVEATDWEGYCKAIIQLMKQHNYKDKQLYMKAIGDVYQGKTRVKFPGYRAFLSAEEGELSWSQQEKASNEEYLDALRAPTSQADQEEVLDNVEEAEF